MIFTLMCNNNLNNGNNNSVNNNQGTNFVAFDEFG